MSLRIDAELKDAFMTAAKSMDRNGSQLIRDFMHHHPFTRKKAAKQLLLYYIW